MVERRRTKKNRKLMRIGNSLGITFPTQLVREFKMKHGDQVKVLSDGDGTFLVKLIKPAGKT